MVVRKAETKYKNKAIKRVPLDMQKNFYEETLKPAADRQGEPVNTFIKTAINERLQRLGELPEDPEDEETSDK